MSNELLWFIFIIVDLSLSFGMVATLGNIVYASIFFNTDILSEVYGKKEARKAVWMGFFALISATVAMQFAIRFKPDISDTMQPPPQGYFHLYAQNCNCQLIRLCYLTTS